MDPIEDLLNYRDAMRDRLEEAELEVAALRDALLVAVEALRKYADPKGWSYDGFMVDTQVDEGLAVATLADPRLAKVLPKLEHP
jgi:hypothetical protein